MGVHSLWDIVSPAARPVKLEALSRKRLAVDASIWIYQFMKAMRDKEGNSLGQTHIVGFFRRICKMLFFGILPLFVFDGGAPPLKRQVIQARKERRQGKLENAASTAQKLLAMQMHRQAGKRKRAPNVSRSGSTESFEKGGNNEDPLYFDDLPMYHTDRPQAPVGPPETQLKTFRRSDEYHLPDLTQFTVRKGDQRIMHEEELEDCTAEQSWDVVDGISIDSVDPSSPEFAELPIATQYMILSHLRLRSRLRLGYSKDQLEHLFPNSRDFSKFQIQQVQKRNFYTQKLMNMSGMGEDSGNVTRRIAGDKDRQYMLVKNEGGWTLSLGRDHDEKAVELDENGEVDTPRLQEDQVKKEQVSDDSDDDIVEDVPLDHHILVEDTNTVLVDGSDDESASKAVIASIYDQYKHEYDDDVVTVLLQDEQVQQKIEDFRDTDLKRAMEESKKDYYEQKYKEDAMAKRTPGTSHAVDSEFGQSLLFEASNELGHACFDVSQERQERVLVDPGDVSDNLTGATEHVETRQAQSMPLWFDDSSHLQSPYALIGFLADRKDSRAVDENEEAGLIPWNEARQYFEETAGQEHSNEDERLEDAGDNDSDVEIIESVPDVAQNIQGSAKVDMQEPVTETSPIDGVSLRTSHVRTKGKRVDPRKGFVQKERLSTRKGRKRKLSSPTEKTPKSPHAENPAIASVPTHNETVSKPDASERSKNVQKPVILDYDFDESEEEDLVKQLREEEQEHAQFTSSIQMDKVPIHSTVSNEQLLQEQLQKAKRDAEEVTQTMIYDVQELLKRFGIPYITAPMEAEAQCAELYQLGLVDGIVTDDSDCFLFGGSRIYKNMFNQKQYVECYIADDVEHKVGLDQTKLIELALLLGSDYTEGIKGVGPVLAMEILAEFGSLSGFKKWFDETTKTLKKPELSCDTKLKKTLIARIKNGKFFLADNFPDQIVVDAYRRPEVDHDKSEFKWGVPLLDQIRSFLMYNVGWTQDRVDEVMVPLIRNINWTRTEGKQTTLCEFFPQELIAYKNEVRMGKRMKAAANRIRGE